MEYMKHKIGTVLLVLLLIAAAAVVWYFLMETPGTDQVEGTLVRNFCKMGMKMG